ncbi:hypothetical protein, partial [Priestia megaterium]
LVNVREWFPKASALGGIYRNLCFSYMTAFIFYFLNVHLQNYKTKMKNYKYVSNKIVRLAGMSGDLVYALGVKGEEVPGKEELEKLCKETVSTNSVLYSRLSYEFENWYDLFSYIDVETRKIVKDLLAVKESLDPDVLMMVINIENWIELYLNDTLGKLIQYPNLEHYAPIIHEYRKLSSELESYFWDKYEPYRQEYWEISAKENLKIKSENLDGGVQQ